jgi:hypothetical protein
MKHIFLLLSVLGLILSCSSLPQVYPAGASADAQPDRACRDPFPDGDWQLLHSIEATLPGGKKGFLMGLTIISSSNRTARCVIMTLEGFVVFDALYDKQIAVKRAIAPFDSEAFANGLIEDINLIFFRPAGSIKTSGFLETGATVCRYQKPDGQMVDLVIHEDRSWQKKRYSLQLRLIRTVTAFFSKENPTEEQAAIPDRLELTAHGIAGYNLIMDLVEAVPLGP